MFDIGTLEFLLFIAVAIVVLGPKRIPQFVRQLGVFKRLVTTKWNQIKWELEREITDDDLVRLQGEIKGSDATPSKAGSKVGEGESVTTQENQILNLSPKSGDNQKNSSQVQP